VFGPARLPPAITRKINAALVPALGSAEFKEQFSDQGIELMGSTPEQLPPTSKSSLRIGRAC